MQSETNQVPVSVKISLGMPNLLYISARASATASVLMDFSGTPSE